MASMAVPFSSSTVQHVAGEVLSSYVDGELDPVRHFGTERHLRQCAMCQAIVDEYRAARAMVRGMPMRPVPEQLGRDLRRRLPR